MTHASIQTWIDNYVDAWRSPGTTKLDELFTNDVSYQVSPWKQPIKGLDKLKPFWEQARSGYDEVFTFHNEIVAIEDKTAVARIEVAYEKDEPNQWRDLWIMKFNDEDLCTSFEEWPFSPTQDDGQNL